MERIWAPWRIDYILGPKDDGCIFCNALELGDDRSALILHRGKRCFVIMNKYPYNNGHLMVAPNEHIADFGALSPDVAAEMIGLLQTCFRVMGQVLHPEGYNAGMNLGKCAGAGVEDHLHFHIVPRWNGDTNFMPVLGETRVIPQHIEETYDALLPHFSKPPR